MKRDISIESIIALPRMNALETVALGEQMITAAKAEIESLQVAGVTLPVAIGRTYLRMQVELTLLKQEIVPQSGVDSKAALAANHTLGGAWRVFFDWMTSLSNAPVTVIPEAPKMKSLADGVFKGGLSFTILSYPEEWTASDTRIRAIADQGYEPVIDALGGAPLLQHVKAAHADFGKVIGIQTPMTKDDSPEVRVHLNAVVSAMKNYVIKVIAHPDPEEPGSEALAEALLYPLVHWQAPQSSGSAVDSSVDAVVEADEAVS